MLDAADKAEAERNKVTGTVIAVAGDADWTCSAIIWKRLDAARDKCPDLVLIHEESRGAERIAAAWAKSRKVPSSPVPPELARFQQCRAVWRQR